MRTRVQEIFQEVVDLPSEARARYFAEHEVDLPTRTEVEELVANDSATNTSLVRNIGKIADRALERSDAVDTRCGPYRVVKLIGRGGMGAVYLAKRADGEVEQQAAIKLLRYRGDDPAFVERFLRERQILASLSHPGIARLLDAGRTENDQPYLAMEYIEGVPIDVYADRQDLRGKLRMFLKVCAAVSYAHRNLVIHRDLKPSNILVEASGEPKLLDFGLARILDAATDQTLTQERMLTPAFASPEQVRGMAQATTSDIYSLGAVLYTLLAGRSPHAMDSTSQGAIETAICLTEAVPPSRVNPALPKDLDFILLKALRKEPEERYNSADALADDLRAFLDSRPVQARSGNLWYRTRKFVQRYWVPVLAAALVMVSLSAGLFIANRERTIAQRHFLEVRQLANKLFDIDALARNLPGSTKTRQLIVDTSLDYLGRLAADAQGDPGLALEVGNAYMRVARVQGVPIGPNLGQIDHADKNLEIADTLMSSVLRRQPGNRMAMLRAAQIAHDRMILAGFKSRDEEALRFAGQSAEWLERFHAGKADGAEDTAILTTYLNVANHYVSARQFDTALELTGHAIELSRTFDFPAYRGTFQWVRARVLQRQGNLDEALRAIQESVTLLDVSPTRPAHGRVTNFAQALVYKGGILDEENGISLSRPDEAVQSLQQAFDVMDSLVHQDANDHSDLGTLAMAAIRLAGILRHSDAHRALAVYDHALGHLRDIKDDVHLQDYAVRLLAGSSYPLRELGRAAEAKGRLDAAFERLRQRKNDPAGKIETRSEAEETLRALADQQAGTGDVPAALFTYQDLLRRVNASMPEPETNLEDAADLSSLYKATAALHRTSGQLDLASTLEGRRLELWRHWNQKIPNNPFVLRQIAAILTAPR